MSRLLFVLCAMSLLVSLVASLPVSSEESQAVQLPLELQEALAKLQLAEQTYEEAPRDKRTIATLRQLFPGLSQSELNPEENQLAGSESEQKEVRVPFTENNDQELAASGGNDAPKANEAPIPSSEADPEEADRNKRLINFGFGAGGGSSGSGAGSGNFLFDIIRRTADRAARAAGTVYRVVAGTESLDLEVTKTTRSSRMNQMSVSSLNNKNNGTARALVAGSGNTEASAEAGVSAGAVGEAHVEKDDGYQAGVPGPITRLFIIANRGIANLMQDLILRLAQTSERLVNFKARLITSII